MSKVFIDTNVLIYSVDLRNARKRNQACECIRGMLQDGLSVISTQVLQEFYVASVKKLGMKPLAAKELVLQWQGLEVVQVGTELIEHAIDCSILSQLSLRDALIVVSAAVAQCDRLLSEDLSDGQIIRGVEIVNPFGDGSPKTVRERGALYGSRVLQR